MGICARPFILATVALLLDPTFADVLVQPGYTQSRQTQKDSASQNHNLKNQQPQNPQQRQIPWPEQLIQQHAFEQQYLQQRHALEKNQLLQMQQHQIQNPPPTQQYQTQGGEIVGTTFGLPPFPIIHGGAAGLHGGRLFSLGPLGLNTFSLGGLGGGLGGLPLLLSPHQPDQMPGSSEYQNSPGGPTQPRARREIREPGDSAGKKYRQKSRSQQDGGLAPNQALKSKSDTNSQNAQSSKSNDDIVGDAHKQDEEAVGSANPLDPLGLMDKAEDFIDDLKDGHLPNPMNVLNGGLLPGLPGWLRNPNPAKPQFEEHVVSQAQPYQYSSQGKFGNKYAMANQQGTQTPKSEGPLIGDVRHSPHPPPQWGGPSRYGNYPPRYPHHGQFWPRQYNSMGYQGNPMIASSNPAFSQPRAQTNAGFNPTIIGAQNPSVQQQPAAGKLPFSQMQANSNGYHPMTGAPNPISATKTQLSRDQKSASPGQSSSMNSMNKGPIVGAQNPYGSSSAPMVGAVNPTDVLSTMAMEAQPIVGSLLNQIAGGGGAGPQLPMNYQSPGMPGAMGGQNLMVGNPLMNGFYNPGGRMMNYYDGYGGFNGNQQRHILSNFGVDDIFDGGYNNLHNGGYDRIYESTIYDDNPYGFGGGYPYSMHSHHSYGF